MRKPNQAIKHALAEFHSMRDSWFRLCLKFVRTCYGIPALYASAIEAWDGAKIKHPETDPEDIPRGVPVFWRGGEYGHVALSCGDGYCWSNDFISRGRIHRVLIADISRVWGFELLGWTEDLNGYRVVPEGFIKKKPVVRLSVLQDATKTKGEKKGQVHRVERALVKLGLLEKKYADGTWGPKTREAYAEWQRRLGYTGQDADGVPGLVSLKALGRRHGFKVVR